MSSRHEIIVALEELQVATKRALSDLRTSPSSVEELTEVRGFLLLVEDRARFARCEFDRAVLA